jgi:hypothetical protein
MAKFIKIEEAFKDGRKYVTYINLDSVAQIFERDNQTRVLFIGTDDSWGFHIPLSDFMDLVNSQE